MLQFLVLLDRYVRSNWQLSLFFDGCSPLTADTLLSLYLVSQPAAAPSRKRQTDS